MGTLFHALMLLFNAFILIMHPCSSFHALMSLCYACHKNAHYFLLLFCHFMYLYPLYHILGHTHYLMLSLVFYILISIMSYLQPFFLLLFHALISIMPSSYVHAHTISSRADIGLFQTRA